MLRLGVRAALRGRARAPQRLRALSQQAAKQQQKKEKKKLATAEFQRSNSARHPKIFMALFAFGVGGGAFSVITFHETSRPRCEGRTESPEDSLLVAVEPVSGTKFPLALEGYSAPDSTHWLVSRTLRCMLNFCSLERARAYSYGVYLSSEAAIACKDCADAAQVAERLLPRHICELEAQHQSESGGDVGDVGEVELNFVAAPSFQGKRPGYVFKMDEEGGGLGYHKDRSGRVNRAVSNAVEELASYPSMALRLVMLRDVEGQHMAHGFDRTLLQRIRGAQGNAKCGTGKTALRQLNSFIVKQGKWTKGTTLEFVRLRDGIVDVRVDGRPHLALRSEALSWALFDAYMGPKGHMSTPARMELINRTKEIASIL